jgi:hypothetical protein
MAEIVVVICRRLQPRKINAKARTPGGTFRPGFFVFLILRS